MSDQPQNKLFLQLAQKWLDGTITPEEELIFAKWYNENQDDIVHVPATVAGDEQRLATQIFTRIQQRKRKAKIVPVSRLYLFRIAAVFILAFAGAGAYYLLNKPSPSLIVSDKQIITAKSELFPGRNRAILKLADGSEIVLDSTVNGNIANQGSIRIVKLDNGKLAYHSAGTGSSQPAFNTLSTPLGGQYQITLKDGTVVWLNAGSSITFPTEFTGNDRKVELEGEAYFSVAENKSKPFKVIVNNMEVLVLGTEFNVMGYNNEAAVKTTLVQGSVKVNNASGAVLLKPGQQAQVMAAGNIRIINHADVEEETAWKNGYFQFEEMDMATIMRQLVRWYNIDVEYEGKVTKHFTGKISRDVPASKVFQMLGLTGEVRFRIDGKKVIVSP